MSGQDDQNGQDGTLRLPWGDANMQALNDMQTEFETGRVKARKAVSFFISLVDPSTRYTFSEFQKHWHTMDKYDFTPEELTLIFTRTAAALNDLKDPQLKKDCLSEVMFRFELWEQQAVTKIQDFTQHDLAMCMWSYRMLNLNPSDEFLNKWYQYAAPGDILRSPEEEHKFVRSIVSLAVAGLKPSKSFSDAWLPKAIMHMRQFSPTQIAYSLWAYARLAAEPEEAFMKAWLQQYNDLMVQNPTQFRQRDIANILGSCGALSAITGKKIYEEIAQKAYTLHFCDACTIAEKRQVGYASLWFGWPMPQEIPDQNERPSKLEEKLTAAFNQAGFAAGPDIMIQSMAHKPDMNFVQGDRTVFIEVDGPSHFLYEINELDGTKQPAGFTGRTLFMSALIHKLAANAVLLRLPHPLVSTILERNAETQKQLLQDLLHTAAQTAPGAYHARARAPNAANSNDLQEHIIEFGHLKIAL
jgi:hypothetical protein